MTTRITKWVVACELLDAKTVLTISVEDAHGWQAKAAAEAASAADDWAGQLYWERANEDASEWQTKLKLYEAELYAGAQIDFEKTLAKEPTIVMARLDAPLPSCPDSRGEATESEDPHGHFWDETGTREVVSSDGRRREVREFTCLNCGAMLVETRVLENFDPDKDPLVGISYIDGPAAPNTTCDCPRQQLDELRAAVQQMAALIDRGYQTHELHEAIRHCEKLAKS